MDNQPQGLVDYLRTFTDRSSSEHTPSPCDRNGLLSSKIDHSWISTTVDEKFCDLRVTSPGRVMNRIVLERVLSVQLCSTFKKGCDELHVAELNRLEDWSLTVLVVLVDSGHNVQVSASIK